MKKFLLSALALVAVAALAITGTIAYLTWDDSDVNVMTMGNVKIEQIEQEWNADKTELVDFRQGKPLMPYVGTLGWENKEEAGGAYRRFTMNNVVDKYVSVKNTGKSDAYVRTVIALEMGEYSYDEFKMIGLSVNAINGSEFQFSGTWEWTHDFVAEIDGKNYNIMVAVHHDPVKPGETTIPSLLQVYLSKDATNETVDKLDGNKNGTYDILVYSQAVQTAGFENADESFDGITTFAQQRPLSAAEIALNTAFYEVTTEEHPWAEEGNEPEIPVVINSFDDLKQAGRTGGTFVLGTDLHITNKNQFFYGSYVTAIYNDMTLDLNGHDIVIDVEMESVSKAPVLFYVYSEGASLTVVGDGNITAKHDAFIFFPRSDSEGLYIYGGNYYNDDETSGTKNDINAIVYSQTNANIHIYGGTFTFKNVGVHCGGFNVYDNSGAEIVLHEGVLLSNSNYYLGSDGNEIHLAEGCVLKEVVIDGTTWYRVVAE